MKKVISLVLSVGILVSALAGLSFNPAHADSNIEGKYVFRRQLDPEMASGLASHADDPQGTEYFYAAEFNISVIDDNSFYFDGNVFDDISMHIGQVDGTAYKTGDNTYRFTYENEYLIFNFAGDKLIIEESAGFSFHGARVTFALEYLKSTASYDDILRIESEPGAIYELNNNARIREVLNKLSWLSTFGVLPEFNDINQVTDEELTLMALSLGVYEKNSGNTKEYVDAVLVKMFGKTVSDHKSIRFSNTYENYDIVYENDRYGELPGSGVPGIINTVLKAQKLDNKYLIALKTAQYNLDYQDAADADWDGVMMFAVIEQAGENLVVKGISLDGFDSKHVTLNNLLLPEIKVTLNGKQIEFDQQPVMENNRTLVPMRAIFEAMGAAVEWYPDTQTVIAKKGDVTVSMQIGNGVFTVNGQERKLDVPPKITGGRTLAPARAVAEGFGAIVDWNTAEKTVVITN
jgi:hypothetical protein